jgi:phenylpropionate dioxygenase-like ring-hydroxylating dioxygenase large terminal subunit
MFLNNTWYVAAWSNEVGRTLLERTICDEPVALYRKEDGTAVAIGNRCPHRFAPLHLGKLLGDIVQCPYHGLQFDETGGCVFNPNGDGKIPKKARVPSYQLVEKHDLIWLWMGEDKFADESKVPDFSCLADKDFRSVGGVFEVEANYSLLIDNLIDLTHAQFLHENTVGNDAIAGGKFELVENGTTVYSNLWCPDGPLPNAWQPAFGGNYQKNVDQWLYMRWDAPGHMLLDVGVTPLGRPRGEGAWVYGTDILTPKDDKTTYYFWGISQNYAVDDAAQDDAWRQAIYTAFECEDKPLLEAQSKMMRGKSFEDLEPVLLSSDVGPVRCRRVLQKLIETQGQPDPALLSLAELRNAATDQGRIEPVV